MTLEQEGLSAWGERPVAGVPGGGATNLDRIVPGRKAGDAEPAFRCRDSQRAVQARALEKHRFATNSSAEGSGSIGGSVQAFGQVHGPCRDLDGLDRYHAMGARNAECSTGECHQK